MSGGRGFNQKEPNMADNNIERLEVRVAELERQVRALRSGPSPAELGDAIHRLEKRVGVLESKDR